MKRNNWPITQTQQELTKNGRFLSRKSVAQLAKSDFVACDEVAQVRCVSVMGLTNAVNIYINQHVVHRSKKIPQLGFSIKNLSVRS